jgi:heat shock protein HslJ
MTDDSMDARLHAAGESWRGANTAEAEVVAAEEGLEVGAISPRHRTRWVTIVSAAVVAAALVVGGIAFARNGDRVNHQPGVAATPTVHADPASRLFGVTWKDQSSDGTVVFTTDTVRTFDGCSNALDRLTIEGAMLKTGKPIGGASTCGGTSEPPAGPERVAYDRAAANLARFYKVLRGPSHWSIADRTLTLTSVSGVRIVLTTEGSAAPSLVGTSWALERVSTDSELPGSYSGATLSIDSSGRFTANDLCNTLSGTAASTASTVDFGSEASTAMACLDPGFTPATAVIDKVLSGAATYAIRGNELIISREGSADTLIYLPAPPQTTDDERGELTGKHWRLTGTETTTTSADGSSGGGSGSSAVGETVLQFTGGTTFTVRHRCYVNDGQAVIGTGAIDFSHVKLNSMITCPPRIGGAAAEQAQNGFVDTLLDGHVSWSIADDQLTLTDEFGHAATFTG